MARDLGWTHGTYLTAIGIRADEEGRVGTSPNVIYPFVRHWRHTKPMVNAAWSRQPFRLGMKGYQGNCRTCWKKSLRKHVTIMRENPSAFDFFERMESTYPLVGPEHRKESFTAEPRRFFRERMTVEDIRRLAASDEIENATDDAMTFDFGLDAADGCSESCEVNFD